MASLSAYYPQPVVAGTTAGTYAEGDHSHELDELDATGIVAGKVLKSDGVDGASWQDDEGGVPTSRTITAGTGLSGGGDLTANRTISASFGNTAGTIAEGDHTHTLISLDASGGNEGDILVNQGDTTSEWVSGATWAGANVSASDIGAADSSHTHGNITNAGAIGSTSGLPIKTGTGGVLEVSSFGTTAGTYAEGNDSRIVGALPSATAGSGSVLASGSTTSRTLSNRFAERVNVLDFGADPTGASSSRDALIAAIAAASNGGIVYLPNGTYSGIHSISITKPISIVGDGSNLTIIDTPDFDVGGNNASPIFSLQAGCTLFNIQDLKIQWEGGLSLGKGRSEGIIAQSNIPTSCEVFVINVVFRNIAEAIGMWRGKISKLFVNGCSFFYKHGCASCRNGLLNPPTNWWETDVGVAGWTTVGNARYTYIQNNEFNGCEDFTFTGVPESCPAWLKTPIDNFYKGGGRPYDVCVVENNIIRNYAIEGILIERNPVIGSWLNENDGFNLSQAVVKGNTLIGPEKVSIYSRGVNPAISIYWPHKVSVIGNYISNSWLGIVTHGIQSNIVTASASDSTFTITYSSQFLIYPDTSNGSSIRFLCKGQGNTAGGGIEIDKQYYVVNAGSLSSLTRTFQLSETPNGSPITVTSNMTFSRAIGENEWQNQQVLIDSNVITGCINGITAVDSGHKHVHALNNYICVESEPCKTAAGYWSEDTTQDPPPDATDLVPINTAQGGITVEKNIVQFGKTAWDGIFDFVSRSGANNNIIELGAGQVAELAALRETADNVTGFGVGSPVVYNGIFTVWNENGVYRWPIDSIDVDNNTVTITVGWATNSGADTFISGKMYWSTNKNWAPHAFVQSGNACFGKIISKDNIVIDAVEDFRWANTRPTEIQSINDSFRDLRGSLQKYLQYITRKNQFSLLDVLQGTGAPTATAPNGSMYLRTDGDASTTLYIRANGAWEPLASH